MIAYEPYYMTHKLKTYFFKTFALDYVKMTIVDEGDQDGHLLKILFYLICDRTPTFAFSKLRL